jgi:predicted metal-binding membrane protein
MTALSKSSVRPGDWARAVVLAVTVAAWVYVVYMAYGMEHMDVGADMVMMPAMQGWGARDLLLVLLMWTLMMVAMMLPSASSMLTSFAFMSGRMEPPREAVDLVGFTIGYVVAWAGYSGLATLLQWWLLEVRLVSPMMEASSQLLGGGLLIAAGAYQFTSWKEQCLAGCRSPISFLAQAWRPEFGGAVRMGWKHGLHCIGCCWLIMLLLFVLGVMNLAWNVALAALVILEKHVPYERWFLRVTGTAFILWGGVLVLGGNPADLRAFEENMRTSLCIARTPTP